MKKILLSLLCVGSCFPAFTQSAQTLQVRNYRTGNEAAIIGEFTSFLSIPNIAADTQNIQRNAAFIMQMMQKRGIENIQLLQPVTPGAPPAVYGEVFVKEAKQTLIFYAHYDGQPVNPAQWKYGPFKPVLINARMDEGGGEIAFPATNTYDSTWRIYARGASDDKGGVTAILNAYDAIIKTGMQPHYNIKFFFEGEEEAGSTHLDEILQKYAPQLQSDLWIICDGPVHQSGKKQIVFGVRGDAHLDLTVYGPKRPLHSGHYGNWAPNPGLMLAKLLAGMKDDNGRVTIKGFYDDVKPLSGAEKKALNEVPSVDTQMEDELGIAGSEMKDKTLTEAINLPSLNINGMQSGNVGKMASNVIPTTATAVLDLRLVLGNDWQRQQQKVIDYIKQQGYTVISHDPTDEERKQNAKLIKIIVGTDGYNAQRTGMDLPVAKKVIEAVKSTVNDQVVLQPTMGGSLPLYLFEKYLNAKTITVPIANHDNNQHAENENIRLLNLWNGIETMAALMMMQ
ncbi:MAG TPA: M20/M25/M40 family metallo-hydrolase [Chitinophagaceae bacterium]|nr:M20/M25/M40 family metallo-hydrolase [Chitinophagaceae bacterium]